MKKILFIFLLLLIIKNLFAEDVKIDSLKKRLENVTGNEKLEILNELAGAYWELPPNERIAFAEQAVNL